jgi:hypothetical protein
MTSALLKVVAVVWTIAAVGVLGYFAVCDVAIFPAVQGGLRPGPAPVKHLLSTGAEKRP